MSGGHLPFRCLGILCSSLMSYATSLEGLHWGDRARSGPRVTRAREIESSDIAYTDEFRLVLNSEKDATGPTVKWKPVDNHSTAHYQRRSPIGKRTIASWVYHCARYFLELLVPISQFVATAG
ncbi:hypothetical protein F4604DRAFT_1675980 [Suillus subluteus]|nr:hypothetical protein F4604DRAFT_1675980 [Suillus subluteus]